MRKRRNKEEDEQTHTWGREKCVERILERSLVSVRDLEGNILNDISEEIEKNRTKGKGEVILARASPHGTKEGCAGMS